MAEVDACRLGSCVCLFKKEFSGMGFMQRENCEGTGKLLSKDIQGDPWGKVTDVRGDGLPPQHGSEGTWKQACRRGTGTQRHLHGRLRLESLP